MDKKLTLEDVKKHNKPNDCWIIIENKVYDVTPFLGRHPGGADSLLESAGGNATDAFGAIGHSKKAVIMTEKYLVGVLE